MIVVVTATKVKTAKVMFWYFVVIVTVAAGKVNKREPVYGKLIGTGLVMDNYVGCGFVM